MNKVTILLSLLRDMEKEFQAIYDEKEKLCYRKVNAFKEAETKRDLLCGYKREQMIRAMGVLEGISLINNVIRNLIHYYNNKGVY